jgi:hypothetical protein
MIYSFNGISCIDLENLGANGGINPEFCDLFPENISSLCRCYQAACSENESTMKVEIEFDNFPGDNELLVTDDMGNTLWYIDFRYHIKGDEIISHFQSCVPKTGPLHFKISDRKHDGLCCEADTGYFLPTGNRGYKVYLAKLQFIRRLFGARIASDVRFVPTIAITTRKKVLSLSSTAIRIVFILLPILPI